MKKDTPEIYPYFLKAVAKRSYEELYNISSDPGCLNNLVGDSKYMKELEHLRNKMNDTLKKTEDARYLNSSDQDQNVWETYPRLNGVIRTFPKPLF